MSKPKKNNGKGSAVGNALRWLVKQGRTVAPEILDLAGSVTGIKQLEELADKISGDKNLTIEDKELLLKQLEFDMIAEQEITKRWQADLHSDSWLSKNIRPLTLAFLLFSMFLFIILDGAGVLSIKDVWVELLSSLLVTAVGGYFVIRGGEKIVNKIKETRN